MRAVSASFGRGNVTARIKQLQVFQNKVHAQIARQDPGLAAIQIATAREIMEVLSPSPAPGLAVAQLLPVMKNDDGKFQLRFSGSGPHTYFIEASTNPTTWRFIGLARNLGLEGFDFEDVHAAQYPDRFYRVVPK